MGPDRVRSLVPSKNVFVVDAVGPTLVPPTSTGGTALGLDHCVPYVAQPMVEALAPPPSSRPAVTFSAEKFDPHSPVGKYLLAQINLLPPELRGEARAALEKNWPARAEAALNHEYVLSLPAEIRPQAAELLVRYFNDPVFEATIHQRAVPHGGVANARQMALASAERPLHAIDKYFGQCNETQQRTQQIFAEFSASWEARFGEGSVKLVGAPVTERSRVLLAYGLLGDAPGDDHMFFAIRARGIGAETMFVDPWISQRADSSSIYRAADYADARQSWDASRWYRVDFNLSGSTK